MANIDTPTIGPDELTSADAEQLAKQAEEIARQQVAQREGLISEIGTEERDVLKDLFANAGNDGASMPVLKKAFEFVDEHDEIREERFDQNARIADLPGNIAGLQNDADRSVFIDDAIASVDMTKEQAVEVAEHERRHTLQKQSNDESTSVPVAGDEEVDALLELNHTAFREEDAMFAAGDAFTHQSYTTEYKTPVNQVASYLNEHGKDGSTLVRNAGLNGEMKEVREAILGAFTSEQLEKYRNN